jgi:hypothetical protein
MMRILSVIFSLLSFSLNIYAGENLHTLVKEQSILATGNWVRLSTDTSGIHKISYSRLNELGIAEPANVAIYSNGGFMLPKMNNVEYPDDLTRLPVLHGKDKNGQNCIYFYSTGSTKWEYDPSKGIFSDTINLYSDSTYFYLSSDINKSEEPIATEKNELLPDTILTTYTACAYWEEEKTNLIRSGRKWFGDYFNDLSRKSYSFYFPNALTGSRATVTIAAAGRCTKHSSLIVRTNTSFIDTLNFLSITENEYSDFANLQGESYNVLSQSNMNIELFYNSFEGEGEMWLDYINLNVKSKLFFKTNQLIFKSPESLNYNTIKYNISTDNNNCVLWNITHPLSPEKVPLSTEPGGISFLSAGRSVSEFILFDPLNGTFPEPTYAGKIKNQNIHGLPSYEMIIVTHPAFLTQSEELAEFHRKNDNMSVLVLTTNEIYNEFSSGLPDVSAIRNMLRFFYSRDKNSSNPLRYVLLMGDGSYNNRTFNGLKSNFIPTYQSENSLSPINSYVMDDFFGLLDENEGESEGLLDIGIGRIPCKTEFEAETVIRKIIDYSSNKTLGEWRNIVGFIADDQDGNEYMKNSDELINLINKNYSGFFAQKIYLDSYPQISTSSGSSYPEVTEEINRCVNKGALIINYIGHANPRWMAYENILGINDIKAWNNSNSLSLFITATCQFGRFDDDENSGGEEILLNPSGGGVGLFTTTRVVYATNNQRLSLNFFSNIFKHDEKGEKLRLGEVMKNAKNSSGTDHNKFNFSLLTDPALRLAFPKYKVVTKSINNINVETDSLTIGALEKVTIKGEIEDLTGNLLSSYNGEVTAVIYDKETNIETLNNDGEGSYTYRVQNNIIYKGVSSVYNGEFELSFIVPKDISYSVGQGRILYYTSNGTDDGNGSISKFNIGGSSKNPYNDNNAPEIELFMNNQDFKSYDKVSSSALLIIKLFDESGINTVGTGIGHDLVAVLDDDYSQQMVLNDFYSSEPNSYQNGKIIFPLTNLEPGVHKIWVKVWDVQNNSSEKEIFFIVEDKFRVTNVQNFPNPVSVFTDFEITHNLPGDVFNVVIDIYNLNGQLINQIREETINSKDTTKIKVRWNIFQSDYPVYSNQWLVYRVTLSNIGGGLNATGAGKILINLQN